MNCTGCGEQHKRPAGKNCPTLRNMNNDSDSDVIATGSATDMNQDILSALTSVSSSLTAIEARITKTEAQIGQQEEGGPVVQMMTTFYPQWPS